MNRYFTSFLSASIFAALVGCSGAPASENGDTAQANTVGEVAPRSAVRLLPPVPGGEGVGVKNWYVVAANCSFKTKDAVVTKDLGVPGDFRGILLYGTDANDDVAWGIAFDSNAKGERAVLRYTRDGGERAPDTTPEIQKLFDGEIDRIRGMLASAQPPSDAKPALSPQEAAALLGDSKDAKWIDASRYLQVKNIATEAAVLAVMWFIVDVINP